MLQRRNTLALDDYLTISEAAALLGVTHWTLRNWDRAGKLKACRHPMNGYRLYVREALEELLAQLATRAERPPRVRRRKEPAG